MTVSVVKYHLYGTTWDFYSVSYIHISAELRLMKNKYF